MIWFAWATFIVAVLCWLTSRFAKKDEAILSWKTEAALWFLVAIFLAVTSNGH